MSQVTSKIFASSEIGTLRRILIHSPDGGIGKVIPGKAEEWLYDDIVDLKTMRNEYDHYIRILLHFLDPEVAKQWNTRPKQQNQKRDRDFFKPDKPSYFQSDKVIDVQKLLAEILKDEAVKVRMVASICSLEKTSFIDQEKIMKLEPKELAKTLISGYWAERQEFIFAPVPNLIFTRDICVTINDHLLITRPDKQARNRESLITKYIAHFLLFKDNPTGKDKIIEIADDEDFFLLDEKDQKEEKSTIEGGDVMMIAPRHLMVGCSERTSAGGINKLIHKLFAKEVVDKITVIKIPPKRDCMHIDTLFTMVKRNAWVLYGPYSSKGQEERKRTKDYTDRFKKDDNPYETAEIFQYNRFKTDYLETYNDSDYKKPKHLEDLFTQICRHDFKCDLPMKFVYSGGGKFPYNLREQWTDSCNVLALKEGVVIGYDRNTETSKAFIKVLGPDFKVVHAAELLKQFESGKITPEEVENTLILLPSGELSRARGGSHCMSMPLLRDNIAAI